MLIKQLSIFLENKKGRFTEVAKILGEAGVNMSAFTVAENSDFGDRNPSPNRIRYGESDIRAS